MHFLLLANLTNDNQKKERTIVMSRAQLQLKNKSKNDWPCSVQSREQLIFLTAAVTITLMLQSEQVLQSSDHYFV